MSERAQRLHATADRQITELVEIISPLNETELRRACPGREKLGDGTIAASVHHTADNYQRIATFVQASDQMSSAHRPAQSGDRIPRFTRALGHRPREHSDHGPGAAGGHGEQYAAAAVNLVALTERLASSRDDLKHIAELTDSQLDTIPPHGSFRFCDGVRSLEQVLAGLLKHQAHQLQAIATATAEAAALQGQDRRDTVQRRSHRPESV